MLLEKQWRNKPRKNEEMEPKQKQHLVINVTDDEVETSILWLPDMKGRLIGKDPDSGKD